MSKNYTHLSLEQRYQIATLFETGYNQRQIADFIGKSPGTVSRELRRNGGSGKKYVAARAHARTQERHRRKNKRIKFNDQMRSFIMSKLKHERYSPELISVVGKNEFGDFVSHERIYQWLWSSKYDYRRANSEYRKLYQYLRHGRHRRYRGARNDRRGLILPNRIYIDKRPRIVNQRKRIGDYEVDFMIGGKHNGVVLVMTDRASLHTKLRKLEKRDARLVNRALINMTEGYSWIKTMTFDNDRAFESHEQLAQHLGISTYFTRPYTSQDKGTVENRIGVLRRFVPKRTNLAQVSHQQLKSIENLLNNRPVRKFNYKTPNQVFSEKIALIT